MSDVIVVLPGILGSVLQKDGRDVWALSPSAAMTAFWTLGVSIKDLQLADDSPDAQDLGDGITATGLIPDLHMVPGLWKIDGYTRLIKALKRVFDLKPNENYFEFPYDWRRDNRVAAKRLAKMSRTWLANYRRKSPNAKLILIAHSMGGLVSRFFLECLEGWKDTRSLITFGTPYRGSLKALDFIANGFKKKVGPVVLLDLSELLRSLTSVYQLLPTYPCYDAGQGMMRVAESASIPGLVKSRAEAALTEFHDKIRDGVKQHEEAPGYVIHPIVGTHQPTFQSAKLHDGRVVVYEEFKGEDLSGDGTVPRVSATPIELSEAKREIFAAIAHASLQNDEAVWTNVEGILRGGEIDWDAFQGVAATGKIPVSMQIDDAYAANEPVVVRARPEQETTELRAMITNTATKAVVDVALKPRPDGWMSAEVPPLPTGPYRVTVYGSESVLPVSDIFAVA